MQTTHSTKGGGILLYFIFLILLSSFCFADTETAIREFTNASIFFGYLVAQFVLIVFIHVFKKDRGTSMVYGIFATILSIIMAGTLLSGFQVIAGVTFIFNINYYLIAVVVALAFYTLIISNAFFNDLKKSESEEHY